MSSSAAEDAVLLATVATGRESAPPPLHAMVPSAAPAISRSNIRFRVLLIRWTRSARMGFAGSTRSVESYRSACFSSSISGRTSGAIRGRAIFDARVIWLDHVRFGTLLEILFIGLPLAFHALYGVVLAFDKKRNPDDYPYRHQHFALLLRASGLLSLLFIAWHIWELPAQPTARENSRDRSFRCGRAALVDDLARGAVSRNRLFFRAFRDASAFHVRNDFVHVQRAQRS